MSSGTSTTPTSQVGVDAVETNTFGANWANLGEYGISGRIRELAEAGARLAREVADDWSTADRPRWVLGCVGPGTKLPVSWATSTSPPSATPTSTQAAGMLAGGVDAILVETAQDLLQAKAAIIGARRAMKAAGAEDVPLIGQRHRRDHRHHAARLGDRRRADGPRAARHRPDRAQLRHRAGRDERAPAPPRRGTRTIGLGLHAQRRPAGADVRRRALPADPAAAGRRARPVHRRVRPRAGRRLLRHDA